MIGIKGNGDTDMRRQAAGIGSALTVASIGRDPMAGHGAASGISIITIMGDVCGDRH